LAGLPRPEAALTSWLEREPGDQAARMMLAQQYIQTQKLPDGARELETVSKVQPNNAAVLNNLAWLYQEMGDRRAVEVGKRAHELAPGNPAIADTYGWILFTTSHSKAALPLLEAAARVASRDPEIQYHYAAALAAEGRKDEALETLRKAMAGGAPFRGRPDAEKLLAKLDG
jgi:predicted Zn-dependent protease